MADIGRVLFSCIGGRHSPLCGVLRNSRKTEPDPRPPESCSCPARRRGVVPFALPALLLGLSALVPAVDPNTLQPQGYVSDFAGVLDSSARADLARYCGAVERATGVQMAL